MYVRPNNNKHTLPIIFKLTKDMYNKRQKIGIEGQLENIQPTTMELNIYFLFNQHFNIRIIKIGIRVQSGKRLKKI